ncbi:MAG TPA: ATP-dependent RNA helicase RhlB, partial [Pseudomonas sp.]|nr:ATP-dependent RNA helicase RhlB [Pseudomonas sp.]
MLKALKKIFGKAPDERADIPTGAPSATTDRQPDPVTQPGATDETQSKPQPSQRSADKPRRQRSSKPPKPAAPAWKLEDFV